MALHQLVALLRMKFTNSEVQKKQNKQTKQTDQDAFRKTLLWKL